MSRRKIVKLPSISQSARVVYQLLVLLSPLKLHHPYTFARRELLDKLEELTDEEIGELRLHVTHGVQLLQSVPELAHLAPIVREHHERAGDGKGYPDGLSGSDISIYGKIVAVADSYDALARPRPYANPKSPHQIRLVFESGSDQFDDAVVRALLSILDDADMLPGSNGHGRLSEIAPGLQIGFA